MGGERGGPGWIWDGGFGRPRELGCVQGVRDVGFFDVFWGCCEDELLFVLTLLTRAEWYRVWHGGVRWNMRGETGVGVQVGLGKEGWRGGGIKYHRISGCVYSYAWYVVWCAMRLGGDWMFILWFVWRWVLVSRRMLGRGRMSRDGRLECIEQKWLDERWDMVQDQKKLWQAVNWEVGLIRFIVSWLAIVCERHWGGSRKCLLIWWSVGGLLQHWPDECRAAYDARPDAREIYRSSKQTRSFS